MKSWNEIRRAATAFSKRWKGAYDEKSQAQSFLKAHQHLDALVDKAYGKKFANDAERVAHLFDLYAYPPPQGAAKRSATRGAAVEG